MVRANKNPLMNYEIEYKYLIKKLPFDKESQNIKKKYIEQIYFKTSAEKNEFIKKKVNLDSIENITTFRVRKIIENNLTYYILTLKTTGQLQREEYETFLSEYEYRYLSEEIVTVIIKNRYIEDVIYNDKTYTFEFDEYLNLNIDLLTCEVEVDSLDKRLKEDIEHILRDVYGLDYEDVTNEKKYKNKYLTETFGTKPI